MKKTPIVLTALFTIAGIQTASAGSIIDTIKGHDCYEGVSLKENMSATGMKPSGTRITTTGDWDQVTLYKSKNGQHWELVGKLPENQAQSLQRIRQDNRDGIVCTIAAGEKDSYKQNPDYKSTFEPKP